MAHQPGYASNLAQARQLVQKGNSLLAASSHALAFPVYLHAAELLSLVVRQAAPESADRRKVKQELMEVLRIAGELKKRVKEAEGEGGVPVNGGQRPCDPSASSRILIAQRLAAHWML